MASVHLNRNSRQAIEDQLKKLLKRHKAAINNQFPYELNESFYNMVMGEKRLRAITPFLTDSVSLLRMSNVMYINLSDALKLKSYVYALHMDKQYVLPEKARAWGFEPGGRVFRITNDEHRDMALDIAEWAQRFHAMSIGLLKSYDVVHKVLACCTTVGQLRKIWPDIFPMLTEYTQERLGSTIARTAPHVPAEVLELFPSVKSLIAAAVILPEPAASDNTIELHEL